MTSSFLYLFSLATLLTTACTKPQPTQDTAPVATTPMPSVSQPATPPAEMPAATPSEAMPEDEAPTPDAEQPQSMQRKAPAEGARIFIVAPSDSASVSGTFTVKFGIEGMQVAPAGTHEPNTGHHHLLIDTVEKIPLDEPLPANEYVMHFGQGQTETTLSLPAGKHTLQLMLADGNHVSFDPPLVSDVIGVTVQ